jgi:hypothetical protein
MILMKNGPSCRKGAAVCFTTFVPAGRGACLALTDFSSKAVLALRSQESRERFSLDVLWSAPALAICASPLRSSWATLFFACHHLQVGILTDHVGQN